MTLRFSASQRGGVPCPKCRIIAVKTLRRSANRPSIGLPIPFQHRISANIAVIHHTFHM